MLHDIGTLALPDRTLGEPPRSDGGVSVAFQSHTRLGYQLLKGHDAGALRTAALIALGHHECFDGSGYPMGLSGDHIPLAARVVALADRLDLLRVTDPDRSWEETWTTLRKDHARRLDPRLVDALMETRADVERVYRELPADARAFDFSLGG
jgi:response regulator RpfG family c-di-GMP phosphodiesterase